MRISWKYTGIFQVTYFECHRGVGCGEPAGVPAGNLMFNPERVLKYLGGSGAGDKIFALTMGRGGEWGG